MFRRSLLSVVLLLAPVPASAADVVAPGAVRAAIAASVSARLGNAARVDVDVLQTPADLAAVVTAAPLPGSRFGTPARFLVTLADGRRATVIARVTADAGHVVASRSVARDADVTADDVEWVEGSLDGQPLDTPTPMTEILGLRARRAIARGEVVTAALVRTPDAVRAGDPVTLVIRRGPIEARGAGRAVSSGVVGETIRVQRPGSREPLRARVTEPGVVEILK